MRDILSFPLCPVIAAFEKQKRHGKDRAVIASFMKRWNWYGGS
jgi:hypothetical protein